MNKIKILTIIILLVVVLPLAGLADNHKDGSKEKREEVKKEKTVKKEEKSAKKLEDRKTRLEEWVDKKVRHLNKTKERINRMPNIDAVLKTKLTVLVDEAIGKFNAEKAKMAGLKTVEEVKNLAKSLKELAKKYKELVQEIVDAIHVARVNNQITKVEGKLADLVVRVDNKKKEGKDAVELEKLVASAKAHIEAAKKSLVDKKTEEAIDHLKEARNFMRDLREGLE